MIKLAYCNIENLDLKKTYTLVSKDRRDKIDSYRFEKDKKLSCGAFLLLKKLLSEENIIDPLFKTVNMVKHIYLIMITFILI